jgi:hypothetical protein
MSTADTNITISVAGLNSTDYSVLKVALGLLEKNRQIKAQILEMGNMNGNIVIADFDTQAGKEFFNHPNSTRKTALLLTEETINDPYHLVLKKPVRVQTLKDVLADLVNQVKPVAKTQPLMPQEKVAESTTSVPTASPATNLFFILFKMLQEKQIVQIFCPPYSPLFVDGVNGIIASSLSREGLRKLFVSQSIPLKNMKLLSADFEVLAKGQLIMPLNHILWGAALYGSHGQLLPEHSAEVQVKLKAWPNFSRLEFEPVHMKLASMMTSQVLTLKQLQEKSQLPWETVVGFYNAAYAIGLVIINPTNSATVAVKKAPIKSGLLAKLANRLKIAS